MTRPGKGSAHCRRLLASALCALMLTGCLVTPVPEDARFEQLGAAEIETPAVNRFPLAADTQVVGRGKTQNSQKLEQTKSVS